MLNLSELSQQDAVLIQSGLKALGLYEGTTRGIPGPKTEAAYKKYLSPRDNSFTSAELFSSIAESQVGERE